MAKKGAKQHSNVKLAAGSSTSPTFWDNGIPAIIFLVPSLLTFVVYLKTTSPSIAGGDSGELVAEGCMLGTAHPPGYPLYILIVWLVTRWNRNDWRFGNDDGGMSHSPAFLVNVTSCIFGSISAGLVALVVFHLTSRNRDGNCADTGKYRFDKSPRTNHFLQSSCRDETVARVMCAVSTSLTCSFSPLMWQYNASAEVFALHNLFVSLILYLLTVYDSKLDKTGCWGIVTLGAFLCGLALTNQHTSILLVVPVAASVIYQSTILKRPKRFMLTFLSFLFGLSPYIALPLFATKFPHAGSWGSVTAWSGFLHHVMRRDYGTLQLFSGDDSDTEGMMQRNRKWAFDLASQQLCHPLLVIFLLVGLVSAFSSRFYRKMNTCTRARKPYGEKQDINNLKFTCENEAGRVIAFALIFYLRFWMHPNILAFVLIGLGMHDSVAVVAHRVSLSMVLSPVVLVLPLMQYQLNYEISDQSANLHFHNYAKSILETVPSDSLLLINYDQQWTSVRYLQECEGVRKDVRSINLSMMSYPWWETKRSLYPDIIFPGTHYTKGNTVPWLQGGFTLSEFIDSNIQHLNGRIFLGGKINYEDNVFHKRYEEIPHGLVRKIKLRGSATSSAEDYRLESLQSWTIVSSHLSSSLPSGMKYTESTWEWTIIREFFDHMVSRSTYLLELALNENNSKTSKHNVNIEQVLPSIVDAAAWLELVSFWDIESHYSTNPSMKKNLGLAYMHMVRNKEIGGFPYVRDIFHSNNSESILRRQNWWMKEPSSYGEDDDEEAWKKWATSRWKEEWGTFLELESSKVEPEYFQIKSIYEAVMLSSKSRPNSRSNK